MEEKKLILSMLKEGKITVDEGKELLMALGEDYSGITDAGEIEEEQREKEQKGEEIKKRVKGWSLIDKLMAGLNLESVTGPTFIFTEEYSHKFTSQMVVVDIKTRNGHIKINTWDKEYAFIKVTKKVRRINSEEKAKDLANSYELLKLRENEITTEDYKNRNLSVDYEITLPRCVVVELATSSVNGKVILENLKISRGKVNTVNGKIITSNLLGEELEISGVNGVIEVEGELENLEVNTVNGRISVIDNGKNEGDVHLSTVNGSIAIKLPKGISGIYIKGSTVNGSVKVEHSELNINNIGGKILNKSLEATSPGDIKKRYNVSAVNGSLNVRELEN
ncbi:DUF4097 and DUF4098 domain-containing protein YvlB [Anaerobranca californiensis DSM 14826]|uniref:DUF4097 and DUF4098 domain-containing protein YvlB n=1 Tax=Anaerobranca californiensis DSM 14826 TaxID=1120989 RepID=A0A1M6PE72_9FIRM|nr:DUF4097 family beta strand repeat-containing protein [Anaerobranca californiensis]SHK06214.1 DUF4097 and DUF4098 domain-containing protein YvlB [Anaerobranca californiensis DSM 14826]